MINPGRPTRSTLEGANLTDAILSDARIEGAKFDAAVMPNGRRNE